MTAQTANYQVALAAVDTAGGVASILNPEGVDLLIDRLMLDITTKTTAACTLDAGVGSGATTAYDNLIDGLDANAAAGLFDNVENGGSNGKASVKWPAGEYLTISAKTGASAGLVGEAIIKYTYS